MTRRWCLFTLVFACSVNSTPPTDAAKRFLAELGMGEAHVSCADADTDQNGYVTCTATVGPEKKILELECAQLTDYVYGSCNGRSQTYATGCKMKNNLVIRGGTEGS